MITAGEYTVVPQDIDCYEGVELTIGKYTSIASGLKIYSGKHPTIKFPGAVANYPFREHTGNEQYPSSFFDGRVDIGNDVWIAKDVRILEGVIIGDGSIIAAGSLVTKDVPPYSFVAGVPGRIKRKRFTSAQISSLLKIKWWNWDNSRIEDSLQYLSNVDEFIKYAL